MAITDPPQYQLIRDAIVQRPDDIASVTVVLWERLAAELIAIIGEGGFDSLYPRSVHLVRVKFPWLATCHPAQQGESRFADLQASLEGRDFPQTSEASIALLITFIDILATLIGESLTNSILRSAWGEDATNIDVKDLRK